MAILALLVDVATVVLLIALGVMLALMHDQYVKVRGEVAQLRGWLQEQATPPVVIETETKEAANAHDAVA